MIEVSTLIDTIRQISAEYPNRTVTHCVYHGTLPGQGCIVGFAFERLGIRIPRYMNDRRVAALDFPALGIQKPTLEEAKWLGTAQDSQDGQLGVDSDRTWGTAVLRADSKVVLS